VSFTESLNDLTEANESGLLGAHHTWARVRIADVCSILNGFPFSSNQFAPIGGTPLIRIRDVVRGWTETHFVGDYDPEFIVRHGELLVGMDGDFNCALWSGAEALLNQRVSRLTPDTRHYDARLLAYALKGYLSAINAKTSAITVKHLSSKTVADISLPLPPRQEQERLTSAIESYFTRLDDAVATLERVQRNLKRYRVSVLKAAVEGRLVPTEAELARADGRTCESASVLLERILAERRRRWEEIELAKISAKGSVPKDDTWKSKYIEAVTPDTSELPKLPEGWCWTSVDQLAAHGSNSLTDGPFGSNLKSSHYTSSGPRVIRLQNIGDGVFLDSAAHVSPEHFAGLRKHSVEPGDIVIASLGTELPRACLVPDSLGPAMVKADCLRFAPHRDLIRPGFAVHALNAAPSRKRAEDLVHGVGRPRIGLTLLRQFPLPLPPLAEQGRILEEIERLLSLVDTTTIAARHNAARGATLRLSILKWAFEGRLVDQDPTDEPASALLERIKAERLAERGAQLSTTAADNKSKNSGRRKARTSNA
jgi:type I restriction enzyme S subunit